MDRKKGYLTCTENETYVEVVMDAFGAHSHQVGAVDNVGNCEKLGNTSRLQRVKVEIESAPALRSKSIYSRFCLSYLSDEVQEDTNSCSDDRLGSNCQHQDVSLEADTCCPSAVAAGQTCKEEHKVDRFKEWHHQNCMLQGVG